MALASQSFFHNFFFSDPCNSVIIKLPPHSFAISPIKHISVVVSILCKSIMDHNRM